MTVKYLSSWIQKTNNAFFIYQKLRSKEERVHGTVPTESRAFAIKGSAK